MEKHVIYPIDFIGYELGEVFQTSRQFIFGDHLLNSQDLYVL